VTRPVNHRERIEGWLRDALAMRGDQVGFIVTPGSALVEGAQVPGWMLFVTMRHPLLGQGDLYVPAAVPSLTLTQSFINRVVLEALKELDDKYAEIQRQAMQQAPVSGVR